MLNVSNLLSLSRAGWALFFLQENPYLRLFAILAAMLSDFFDGYLARRQRTTTSLGAILDPLMDKFFVFFAGGIFFVEGGLSIGGLLALLSRDFSLVLFALFLGIVQGWRGYECKAIFWGKIITVAQFLVLIGLTFQVSFPSYVYVAFIVMAAFAFLELLLRYRHSLNNP
ncbi:MAG: CDP-diacylglycerol--glycerol-3-phosphate 3-phosphatidyltransferase [Chlamydiae bacterium]|nr:CDP-diacylglycerol--glycerol-3-phosphate 3-phosphatidyltransferase [Chlamydiota bacterium]